MYLRITSRCNFRCAHCLYSCTNRGKDMEEETFRAAIQFAKENGMMVTFGGGEPTLHPKFFSFLFHAMVELVDVSYENDIPAVGLVTNGSQTEIALKLAKMAKVGMIWAAVSDSPYHDEIDSIVFDAFRKPKRAYAYDNYSSASNDHDHREIRRVEDFQIVKMGRAKTNGIGQREKICCGMLVQPDGKVWECDCKKVLYGQFPGPINLPEDWNEIDCSKDKEYK